LPLFVFDFLRLNKFDLIEDVDEKRKFYLRRFLASKSLLIIK